MAFLSNFRSEFTNHSIHTTLTRVNILNIFNILQLKNTDGNVIIRNPN